MLVDSHCHLDLLDFTGQSLNDYVERAKSNDVAYILCPGITLAQSQKNIELLSSYPNVRLAIGEHPTENVQHKVRTLEIIKLAEHPNVVAIGETGLDYYERGDSLKEQERYFQKQRFIAHIHAAKILKKPLIIHSRHAALEVLEILRAEMDNNLTGVFHCFSDDWDVAVAVLDLNFYISIPGIITFKNAAVMRDVVTKMPLNRLLLETDAPYLSPEPYRGKPNEPAHLRYVAEKIATIRNVEFNKLAEQTTANFFQLFSN